MCDNPPGYYYLMGAQQGSENCAHVRSKCTNVRRGEIYVQQNGIVTSHDGCNVSDCPKLPDIGKYFAISGL